MGDGDVVNSPVRPSWNEDDQDVWIEFYQGFCNNLLEFTDDLEHFPKDDEIERRVKLAARMADLSLQELYFRDWEHKQIKAARKRPPRKRPGGKYRK